MADPPAQHYAGRMPNACLPINIPALSRPIGPKGSRSRALVLMLLAGALAAGPGRASGQPPTPIPATTQAPPPTLPLTATPSKPGQARDVGAAAGQQPIADLALSTLAGGRVVLSGLLKGEPPKRALVVAITSATCPISKRYAARIAGLETEFAESAAFVYVNPVDGESVDQMRESVRAYGFKGPYVVDAAGEVRKAMRPVTTTEVFVLTGDLRVAYRGAVDDQYRLGGAAAQVSERYLRDAIVAVVAGNDPAVKATSAPGCLIELPPEPQPARGGGGAAGRNDAELLEYYPQVSAIVERSCVSCHRLGGPAPFSLESPGAVRGRGKMIEAVIGAGIMPPNHAPRAGGGGLADPGRVMTAADKELLARWLNSARAVGVSSEAPPARAVQGNTWTIGLPDLILTSQGITLAAEGPMRMTRQLVPVNIESDRLVEKVECRPVMPDSIENAIVWLVEPGEVVPPAGVTIPAGRVLGTYSPGDSVWASALSGGVQRLRAGSVLVVDSFARPMGRSTTSQLRVALKFATAASGQRLPVVGTMVVSASSLDIGAGTREARASASMKLDKPVRLLAVQPVMRSRGREFTAGVTLASGERLALIDLGRFDWRWQIRYPLAKPLELAAGSTIELSGVFDNSTENHFNPDATRAVNLGPEASDETLMAIIEVLVSE